MLMGLHSSCVYSQSLTLYISGQIKTLDLEVKHQYHII